MPLCDDLRLPLDERLLRRRRFLGMLGAGALGSAGLGTLVAALEYLRPNVLFEEARRFIVGRPQELPLGAVRVLGKQKVYVVRQPQGVYALSSVCTHLGCMTRYERSLPGFVCPCHGSRFALDGQVTNGPAPRPLPRLEVSVERGLLVVDAARAIAPGALLRV